VSDLQHPPPHPRNLAPKQRKLPLQLLRARSDGSRFPANPRYRQPGSGPVPSLRGPGRNPNPLSPEPFPAVKGGPLPRAPGAAPSSNPGEPAVGRDAPRMRPRMPEPAHPGCLRRLLLNRCPSPEFPSLKAPTPSPVRRRVVSLRRCPARQCLRPLPLRHHPNPHPRSGMPPVCHLCKSSNDSRPRGPELWKALCPGPGPRRLQPPPGHRPLVPPPPLHLSPPAVSRSPPLQVPRPISMAWTSWPQPDRRPPHPRKAGRPPHHRPRLPHPRHHPPRQPLLHPPRRKRSQRRLRPRKSPNPSV